jgi:hypothetical protein
MPHDATRQPEPMQRVVAVDWSGDRSVAGQKRKIWAGVWTAGHAGGAYGGRVTLESDRTRDELTEWLIALARDTPRLVVGVDFCFSYPEWFVRELGAATAPEFWAIAAARGEDWLGRECADARFWGRAGGGRDGKKPPEFCAENAHRMFREADLACKVQGRILDPSDAAKVKGIAPKSPFQIGGAGAVGTGTLRGIPQLLRLRRGGFSVWPFDVPRLPVVLEIYPRLMTGAVNKGSLEDRKAYLSRKRRIDPAYRALAAAVVRKARESEDAFDALVSAMAMAKQRASFLTLKQAADPCTLMEGAVWGAKG